MAWVAEETFDSYSDGNVVPNNGGTGWAGAWSGSTNYQVQGTVTYQGAKATLDASGSNISRTLTSAITDSSSTVYVAMRRSVNNSGATYFDLYNAAVTVRQVKIALNASGNIVAGESGGTTILAGYSADTWYVFRITMNAASGTYKVAYSTGAYGSSSTFSSDTADVSMGDTSGIGFLQLNQDTGGNNYWDYISPTSPFIAATANGNMLAVF